MDLTVPKASSLNLRSALRDGTMQKKTLALAILTLCFTHSADAGIFDHCNLFGKKKPKPSRPIVSPYSHPTYGYNATRWRRFPGAYYPNDLRDMGPVGSGFGGSYDTYGGGSTELDSNGFGTPSAPTYMAPFTTPAPAPAAPEHVLPSMDSIQNLAPQTTPPPTPPSASQRNTDAMRGVREALVPVTPGTLNMPVKPVPTQRTDIPQPAEVPFPPLKRTTYSVRVAPSWGSGYGTNARLPQVRPMPQRNK